MTAWLDQKLEARGLERADLFIWPLGMAVAVLWALPFVWMVSTSFKFPGDVMTKDIEWLPHRITLNNYIKVFDYPVIRWGFNSVVQATVSTFLCVLFGAMAVYALALEGLRQQSREFKITAARFTSGNSHGPRLVL